MPRHADFHDAAIFAGRFRRYSDMIRPLPMIARIEANIRAQSTDYMSHRGLLAALHWDYASFIDVTMKNAVTSPWLC